jgi:hypothetical protein
MTNQIYRAVDVAVFLILGLALVIYPDVVNDTLSRIIGAYFIVRSISPALKFYKKYKGKKVVDELTKEE